MRAWSPESSDVGHTLAAELGRPGIVRVFKQAGGVGVIRGAIGVAQDAGQQPRNRIDKHQGGQLTAGQDEIADRDLVGHELPTDALIHTLVAAADNGDAGRAEPARQQWTG